MQTLPEESIVLEPFSGSCTTPLVAQELGIACEAQEINPFLVWFGNVKLATYTPCDVEEISHAASSILLSANKKPSEPYWTPNIYQIQKWWDNSTLTALSTLKHYIDAYEGKVRDILDVVFCRTMIATSNASFNHQSMSFKNADANNYPEEDRYMAVIEVFNVEAFNIIKSLEYPLVKTAKLQKGDSTKSFDGFSFVDYVITSPPYANRMSYIRELRPYMYWLGFLSSGSEAGELDWKTTGGTWGSASTKVKSWTPTDTIPIEEELDAVCKRIQSGKSGEVLSPYVRKYFHDIWHHFNAVTHVVKHGGKLCYIIGNSTFSGIHVPSHVWYADMMSELGYKDVLIETIRKRNSNKRLFEYAVCATKQG